MDPNQHHDLDQHYDEYLFWTRCQCGMEFAGETPDDADGHHMAHRHDDMEHLRQYLTGWVRSWGRPRMKTSK